MPTITGDSGSNYLEGTFGADQINGLEGSDTIVALGGNDTIDGGSDEDTIDAGDGDDIVYGGDGWDTITDGAGSDTVYGGAGSDRIIASPGAGNDYYDGGTSAESDWIDYSLALAGVLVDLGAATNQAQSSGGSNAAGIGIDQLTDIENVQGTAFGDTLTGNSADNRLFGAGGNDRLIGGAGNDVLNDVGGAFAWIEGGAGDDAITVNLQSTSGGQVTTIMAGSGYDGLDFGMTGPGSAIIDMGEGGDNISLTATPSGGTTITLGDAADLFSEAIHFQVDLYLGSTFGPITITDFDPGRSDGYIGLPGDWFDLGSYTYNMLLSIGFDGRISPFYCGLMRLVQVGADAVLEVDLTGHGNFSILAIFLGTQASEFTIGNFSGPNADNINSPVAPPAGQTINGDSGSNSLTGGGGTDTINGQDGNDTLNGRGGNDVLTGGAGNDIFVVSRSMYDLADRAGRDTITDFTPNIDRLDLTGYGFRYFSDVLSRAYQDGANVVIRIAPRESVTLQNVQLASLDVMDFVGLISGSGLAVLPGPEPTDPNVLRPMASDYADVNVGSGQLHFGMFANGLFTTSGATTPIHNITNDGTIWVSASDAVSAVHAYGAGNIVNRGSIYSVASSGDAWGFHFDGGFNSLDNSGTISVVSWQSRAIGIETYDFRSTITNSGTISARGEFDAYAIAFYNGVEPSNESTTPAIANSASGKILAEGPGAVAIYLAQAPIYNGNKIAISNLGLIEARSLSNDPSIAILVGGHGSGGTANIINSGTIRADIAYYTDPSQDTFFSTATLLTNETGGLIFGAIFFAERADTYTNRGTLTGDLYADGGNDVVDTSIGRIIGYVDLGDGADQYLGSAFADDVYGGSGNDNLSGNGGNDWLDGGTGADTMNGGTGDDVYVVDDGSDIITEAAGQGADFVYSSLSFTLGANVEAVELLGSAALNATGNTLNNYLFGNSGANVLTGALGIDYLEGGAGADTFRDTKAGLSGDTIADLSVGDKIVITDATLAGFTFSLTGSTLTYSGGSLTLTGFTSALTASAAAGGGVQLTVGAPAINDARNDFNGDGRSDILWRNVEGQMSNWLGQANGGFVQNNANAAAVVPVAWQIAGTGDFNGDGRDDILWRNVDGQISNWLATAAGGYTQNNTNAAAVVPTAWHVVGTGDFNGDGRDDILWRNNDGTVSNWLGTALGGFTPNDANAARFAPTDWHVVGTGDFNGDGRDDVLWRNDNGQLSNWLGTATGGFTLNDSVALTQVDPAWRVAGTGDFNGDGRDDILWRHTDGTLSNWLGTATGGFVNNGAVSGTNVPLAWSVVAVGDYNGDGRDDILWRHTDGTLSNWLGTATGGFTPNDANAATPVPVSWDVQPEPFWL